MRLVKVDIQSRREVSRFIEFPFKLYPNHPFWTPALRSEMAGVFNHAHPFYKHSNADFFLAENEHQILGRIAVLQNKKYNAHHQTKTAFIYYFDAVEDSQVSTLLFEAAAEWAKKEQLNRLLGPKGFTRSSGVGVLVEGFEYLPAMGIAYNHPYYGALFEEFGFTKETDFLSGYMDYSHHLPERILEAGEKIKRRGNFWTKEFTNKSDFRKWIHVVEEVHSKAFANNPNYIPSTSEEFQMMATSMMQISKPGLIKLILKKDQVAGFIIAYPNVNRAIQTIKGNLWPFGWLKVLKEKNQTKLCDLNGLGLLPEYQGAGANLLLYSELEKTLRQSQFRQVELIQIDERNEKSKSDMENMGVTWHKRHRTFEYHL
ncbi:MAG: hypothetical protein IT308_12700 [Anaerolineaceae bacterium]|nr:hypothetical protein [Anaerolineaceae bacterium]